MTARKEIIAMQSKMILPAHLNDNNTFFGGVAMAWMDEIAYLAATRYTRQKMITVSADHIQFLKSIVQGDIVEICGHITAIHGASMQVGVEIYKEEKLSGQRVLAVSGNFVLAAVNADHKPIRIRKYNPEETE